MEGWMIVQIIVCVALILVVMFHLPRKAGLGGWNVWQYDSSR